MSDIDIRGRHFLSTLDYSIAEIDAIIRRAMELKAAHAAGDETIDTLRRKVFALLFFNPSVRTRVSCEASMARFGGHAIALNPGKDTWQFEAGSGVVMDGSTQEHVRELAPVLSRYCDVIGMRKSELVTTGSAQAEVTSSYDELKTDSFMRVLAEHSEVPVVNLESNRFHPLQGIADQATMVEKLGEPRGQKYVLTWAWHPKPLPVATPHSQLLAAAHLGMNVTLLRPEGWGLEPEIVAAARERAESLGGSLTETDDIEGAYGGARVVCAKAWGSLDYYGRFDEEAEAKKPLRQDWLVDERKMALGDDALFMHCLPVRRNVVVTDGVIESRNSVVVDEAENRLWTVAALLSMLLAR